MVARCAPSRPIRVTVTFAARLDHRCFAYLRVWGRVRLRICKASRQKGGRLDKSGRHRSAETPAPFARGSHQPGVSGKPNAPALPGPPCSSGNRWFPRLSENKALRGAIAKSAMVRMSAWLAKPRQKCRSGSNAPDLDNEQPSRWSL